MEYVILDRKRVTIDTLRKNKAEGRKTSFITAYTSWQAELAEEAGIGLILVGDSCSMVEHGYNTTIPITMEEMLSHAKAVSRSTKFAHIVGDMPFNTYGSCKDALDNAGKFLQNGCDSVKLEGCHYPIIKHLTKFGVPVMGHIGMQPQSINLTGNYKIAGKNNNSIEKLVAEAKHIEWAGAYAILLEGMPDEAGKAVVENTSIPIYGIGAGKYVDGQLLIFHDLCGLYSKFTPKFAKKYCDARTVILNGLKEYRDDVEKSLFPFPDNIYESAETKKVRSCIAHNWDKANRRCFNCGMLEKDLYDNKKDCEHNFQGAFDQCSKCQLFKADIPKYFSAWSHPGC